MSTHPLQTDAWARAKRALGGRVLEFDGTDIDGEKLKLIITLHKLPLGLGFIGYIPRSKIPNEDSLQKLVVLGKGEKIVYFLLEPDVSINEINMKILRQEKLLSPAVHSLFPKWTLTLDISQTEEELLKNMHPKTRYNIRLAQKKGIEVFEENSKDGFEIFQKLYFETTKRQKYFGHDSHYHKVIWETLSNAKIATILNAYFNEIPLASYELFQMGKTLYYPYGGTSELHRENMASTLLMWEAIKLGKTLGCDKFDMWGAMDPSLTTNSTWAGFTRFKLGFGAIYEEKIGSFDLVVDLRKYQIVKTLWQFRDLLMNFKRKFI